MHKSKYEYESMKKQRKMYNKKHYYGPTSGKYESRPWNDNDERIIMFSEKSDTELSELLHRSVGSIQNRRYHINKQGRSWLKDKKPVTKATPARKDTKSEGDDKT